MKFRIFTEPQQGATYEQLLGVARAAERLGYDAFFRSDHFLLMGDHFSGLPGPTDAWTTLAGLARETSTIRLGTLVSSVTHRWPGILAIQVAQVDHMSGGRVEFGLGTGWFEAEHRAYGIPFPDHRFEHLSEQLEVVTGLWNTPVGEKFSFLGRHYQLTDSPALPKPVQTSLPIIVGGHGPSRTPRLAARHATEFNLSLPRLDDIAHKFGRVRAACEAINRDPSDLTYSVMLNAVAGRDRAEYLKRSAAAGLDPVDAREHGLSGTAQEISDRVGVLQARGVDTVYLQILDVNDLEHLEVFAEIIAAL